MLKVAVTSGISCGKSVALGLFAKNRIKCIDCDKMVSLQYSKNSKFKKFLLKNFGTAGKKSVSKIAFSNPKKLRTLEKYLWPVVANELRRLFSHSKNRVIIAEVPMLFEAHMEKLFDVVIVLSCPRGLQISRAMKSMKISKKEALKRIRLQMPLREKVKRANYVIDSGAPIRKMKARIENISIILLCRAGHLKMHEKARKKFAR
jgi:dephospho-CoA kinase